MQAAGEMLSCRDIVQGSKHGTIPGKIPRVPPADVADKGSECDFLHEYTSWLIVMIIAKDKKNNRIYSNGKEKKKNNNNKKSDCIVNIAW